MYFSLSTRYHSSMLSVSSVSSPMLSANQNVPTLLQIYFTRSLVPTLFMKIIILLIDPTSLHLDDSVRISENPSLYLVYVTFITIPGPRPQAERCRVRILLGLFCFTKSLDYLKLLVLKENINVGCRKKVRIHLKFCVT